jgi:hypothetical protein
LTSVVPTGAAVVVVPGSVVVGSVVAGSVVVGPVVGSGVVAGDSVVDPAVVVAVVASSSPPHAPPSTPNERAIAPIRAMPLRADVTDMTHLLNPWSRT